MWGDMRFFSAKGPLSCGLLFVDPPNVVFMRISDNRSAAVTVAAEYYCEKKDGFFYGGRKKDNSIRAGRYGEAPE